MSIAALAILGTLVYLLTGGTIFSQKVTIHLYIPDATGLGPGSPVRVDGIGVGKVSSVALTGSNQPDRIVKVTMTVEREHLPLIPSDSTAQISSDTMIGDKFVDISSGKSPKRIGGGTEIAYQADTALLKSLDMSQFEQQLRTMDAVITDIERGRSRVGQFVVGEETYSSLQKNLLAMETSLWRAADATTEVGSALTTDRLYRQVSDPLRKLDQSLARLQSAQDSGGRLLRDPAQYEELRKDAASYRTSVADLRASGFLASDAQYVEWSRGLASLIQKVAQMNASPYLATSELYDNLNGAAAALRDNLKDFRLNPKKFLRLKLF